MNIMMHHGKQYRVFELADGEPYVVIRARDPFAARVLGTILDVIEENGGKLSEDLLSASTAFIEWQSANADLVKWDIDFKDFQLIKKASNE